MLYEKVCRRYEGYMEKQLNVENDWNGEIDCVMGPCCLMSDEEVEAAINGLKIVR